MMDLKVVAFAILFGVWAVMLLCGLGTMILSAIRQPNGPARDYISGLIGGAALGTGLVLTITDFKTSDIFGVGLVLAVLGGLWIAGYWSGALVR
jgi:hypothetical protein